VRRRTISEFWEKVERSDGCWIWTGYLHPSGYGQWWLPKPDGHRAYAHRFAYEQIVGPIPDGLTLDHLCRNRACVNPVHLEPVTNRENILRGSGRSAVNVRKTECPKGHPYTAENTYRNPTTGKRRCISCSYEAARRRRALGAPRQRTPEARARLAARVRVRWASDLEYRERRKAANRDARAKSAMRAG
jgi:hypothetical protein